MTRLARITVVLFVAAGIAFLGLLTGGRQDAAKARRDADPMQGYYEAFMPRYPGVGEYPLGSELKVSGTPMKMSYFHTEDDPLKVASFYVSHWKAANYHVTEDITLQGGVVGAYDPASGQLRQVLIKVERNRTSVFPSLVMQPMRPEASGGPGAGEKADVPVYPGAEGVLHFGARDPGHESQVTMYTNYGGLANNVGFFRSRLPELGWKEVDTKGVSPLPVEMAQTLTFHKGRRELTVNLAVIDSANRVRVHVAEGAGPDLGLPEGRGTR
jgi:hypothetical protein